MKESVTVLNRDVTISKRGVTLSIPYRKYRVRILISRENCLFIISRSSG